jgi:hypothetical protein
MRIVVSEVTGQGSVRSGVLDTAGRADADHYADLVERAALDTPPPYRPVEGRSVYRISAGEKTVLVAEKELAGPLRELVMLALGPAGQGRSAAAGQES